MSLFEKRKPHIEDKEIERNWETDIIDAVVVGGLTVFSNLMSLGATNIVSTNPAEIAVSMLISFGVGFFSTLAAKWGLNKYAGK